MCQTVPAETRLVQRSLWLSDYRQTVPIDGDGDGNADPGSLVAEGFDPWSKPSEASVSAQRPAEDYIEEFKRRAKSSQGSPSPARSEELRTKKAQFEESVFAIARKLVEEHECRHDFESKLVTEAKQRPAFST